MSQGTLKLVNGSKAVVGTGTNFVNDLTAADFIVITVGGVTYSLVVGSVQSGTGLTLLENFDGPSVDGAAWTAVPYGAQMRITQQLGTDISRLMRYYLLDKNNWNAVLTGPDDVTVTLPDGTQFTGPSWPKVVSLIDSSYQSRGQLNSTIDLNTLGPDSFGIWVQPTDVNATTALNYPENKGGTLEVLPHRQGAMQRYTTQTGNIYLRTPSGAWDGTSGPWLDWNQIGSNSYTSPLTGAKKRTLNSKLSDAISVLDFADSAEAVAVDGSSAMGAALKTGNAVFIPSGVTVKTAIASSWAGVLIVDGVLQLTNTGTLNCDVLVRAGSVDVASGTTATFSGAFRALERKIFTGAGTVLGIATVKPEWWGAARGPDSANALEAAFNCAVAGTGFKRKALLLNAISIGRTVNLRMKTQAHIDILGGGNNIAGGRINCLSGFTGSVAMLIDTDGVNNIASFDIKNFAIENNAAFSVVTGIQITNLSGIVQNGVYRVSTHGFGYGFDLVNSRLVTFDSCATWKEGAPTANGIRFRTTGAPITDGSTGTFVGDCRIINCQFEPAGPGACVAIEISIQGHQCKGVVLAETALYKSTGGTQFVAAASSGGIIGDVFIDAATQWDGYSNQLVNITADGAGSRVDDIIFNGAYFRGVNNPQGFRAVASNGGTIGNIRTPNCWFANMPSPAMYLDGVNGLDTSHTQFHDITNGGGTNHVVVYNNCKNFTAMGMLCTRTGASNFYGFIQTGGSSDGYVITGNNAGGIPTNAIVTDSASGTRKVVANNI